MLTSQEDLFPQESDAVSALVKTLPPLPTLIRYQDDFDETVRSIKGFQACTGCTLHLNGSESWLSFSRFGGDYALLAKHLFVFMLGNELRVSSAYLYMSALGTHVERKVLCELIDARPQNIKFVWSRMVALYEAKEHVFRILKICLQYLSENYKFGWSPTYLDFIQVSLPYPHKDPYASVRNGDAFLGAVEEAKIVQYLDSIALQATGVCPDVGLLRQAGMLLCAYQFGMRPLQISTLRLRDVRIWTSQGGKPSIHLTFWMRKQRNASAIFPLTRKVKEEWASIFNSIINECAKQSKPAEFRLFDVESADETAIAIRTLATKIVEIEVNTTDLRHTAAQRMVDSGCSQEELAEFMGHTSLQTGLVYYQTSASQAERVNKALAISPVYQRVVKIAHDKFISAEELAELKGEQQIAGVPHGIPIAGIGGCSSGQPSCPFNPVTSCYGCGKFMPVDDPEIHRQALKDLREVVLLFSESSRGDVSSPTYLQLRRTLEGIQQVITELEGNQDA